MKWLLDTNIAIYLLGGRLAEPLPTGEYLVSVITELELLSYPSLDSESEKQVRDFLEKVSVIGLTTEVKERTVMLRRHQRLKLPDAIVVATALILNAELLTNDTALQDVPGLKSRGLALSD